MTHIHLKNKLFAFFTSAAVALSSPAGTFYAAEESDEQTITIDGDSDRESVSETENETQNDNEEIIPQIVSVSGGYFTYPDESGNVFYILDGKKIKGLCMISGKVYLFAGNGIMTRNKKIRFKDGRQFFFGDDGSAYTGRQIINGNEYTFSDNGVYIRHHVNTDFVDSSDMYTYDELCEDLPLIKDHYPELFDYSVIGTTADRRNIYDITIGSKNADRQIVFVASCHAREYMTSLLVMDMAEYLLNSYYEKSHNGVPYKDILSEYAIHIVPMLNPDGVTISQFGADGLNSEILRNNARVMYKNAVTWGYTSLSEEDYYKRWKANARGVDINRNFDAKWDIIETLKGRTGANFKGFEPMSERESICISEFIKSLSHPETVVSYHATGSMIYWDYGQTGDLRERSEKQIKIVKELTGYTALDYSEYSSGGLSDYIIAENMDIVPETIEIGTTPAPVDMSEYDEIYNKNFLIPISLAEMYLDYDVDSH